MFSIYIYMHAFSSPFLYWIFTSYDGFKVKKVLKKKKEIKMPNNLKNERYYVISRTYLREEASLGDP